MRPMLAKPLRLQTNEKDACFPDHQVSKCVHVAVYVWPCTCGHVRGAVCVSMALAWPWRVGRGSGPTKLGPR